VKPERRAPKPSNSRWLQRRETTLWEICASHR